MAENTNYDNENNKIKIPENHGKKWTNDDDMKLVGLVKDGKNFEEISNIFKRTKISIELRIYLNIIKERDKKNDSLENLCKIYNCNIEKINKFIIDEEMKKENKKKYKEEKKQKK